MWGKRPLKKEAVVPNFKAKKAFARGRIDDSLFRSWVALLLYMCVPSKMSSFTNIYPHSLLRIIEGVCVCVCVLSKMSSFINIYPHSLLRIIERHVCQLYIKAFIEKWHLWIGQEYMVCGFFFCTITLANNQHFSQTSTV